MNIENILRNERIKEFIYLINQIDNKISQQKDIMERVSTRFEVQKVLRDTIPKLEVILHD